MLGEGRKAGARTREGVESVMQVVLDGIESALSAAQTKLRGGEGGVGGVGWRSG